MPAQGGQPRRLTERYDRGAMLLPPPTVTPGPTWSKDNASVTFIAGDHGNMHLVRTTIGDGSTSVVVGAERQIVYASGRAGLGIAFAAGDLAAPSDLFVTDWDGRNERRLTHINKEILAQHTGQPIERLHSDTDRDFVMTAAEAREYGIIDEVIDTRSMAEAGAPIAAVSS